MPTWAIVLLSVFGFLLATTIGVALYLLFGRKWLRELRAQYPTFTLGDKLLILAKLYAGLVIVTLILAALWTGDYVQKAWSSLQWLAGALFSRRPRAKP